MLLRYERRDALLVALLVAIWLLPAAFELSWTRGLVPWSWPPVFVVVLAKWPSQTIEYAEHYGSATGERGRDAASGYAPLYNWFWINDGYHQEHHLRPGVDWAKIPLLRERLPSDATRAVYDAIGILPHVRVR